MVTYDGPVQAVINGPRLPYRTDCGLHELFEASVARTPTATAAVYGDQRLTYAELDGRARAIAIALAAEGVGPGQSVGLCLPHTPDVLGALLGILKCAAVCVPLDPAYPVARTLAMIADADVQVVVTVERYRRRLESSGVRTLFLDGAPMEAPETVLARASGSDTAYLIYTSGSTGTPKGVMLTHAGLANHAQAAVDLYGITASDAVLQISSISFDISVEEMFPVLAAGGRVVFRGDHAALAGAQFLDALERDGVTVLDLPTALWRQWVHDLDLLGSVPPACLRAVIVGGEKADAATLRTWQRIVGGRVRWFNTYGPTETSVIATVWEAPGSGFDADEVPLGGPIPNVALYVLDAEARPVSPGVPGELFIGGGGVAAGYRNRPELSAERFVPDPFAGETDARMYRTGDLVSWAQTGTLEFLGRNDDQVKVRGFRVEPSEVAAVVARFPDVRDAVVVAPAAEDGRRHLVAYVIARDADGVDDGALRAFLSQRLPDHMIPWAVVTVDGFPLTPNGKLDRAALPAAPKRQGTGGTSSAPSGDIELTVAQLWEEMLDVEDIGADDDFFVLGGHSLLAVRMLAELEARFHRPIPMPDFFDEPTVSRLARVVRDGSDALVRSAIQPVSPGGARPPFLHVCTGEPGVMALRHFRAALGPDQPVAAIVLRRLTPFGVPGTTVSDLAAAARSEMVAAGLTGPVMLSGYSVGGLVAFELARQFQAEGRPVPLLSLVDTWSSERPGRSATARKMLKQAWRSKDWSQRRSAARTLAALALGPLAAPIRSRLRSAPAPLRPEDLFFDDPDDPMVLGDGRDPIGEMYWSYRPGHYGGRTVLFRTDATAADWDDDTLWWDRRSVPGLIVDVIPGDHGTVMRSPNVEVLGSLLAAEIDDALRQPRQLLP